MEEATTSAPAPKKAISGTGLILVIVLGVLFLIAAGSGGFAYYKYSKAKGQVSQLNSQVEQLNSQAEELNAQVDSLQEQLDVFIAAEESEETSQATTSSCAKTGTMPTNGYVISDSNSRVISESELSNLTPWQLKVARNEIYARHGRAFVHKDLSCYFANQSWYSVNPNFSSSQLSTTENKNIATILNYEKKTSSPCLAKDSGC